MSEIRKAGGTRVESVTVRLRDMILGGEIAPGERVTELDLASSLGVSRTPVRLALGILESEGLLEGAANRGFTVKRFTKHDVLSAFDVRGALEGLACRVVAENGLTRSTRLELEGCIEIGNSLIGTKEIGDVDMRRWSKANEMFHRTIIDAAGLSALDAVYQQLSKLPLASPVAILFRGDRRVRAAEIIHQSHDEHTHVFDALVNGEGARAEALMKEHAYRSKRNIMIELQDRSEDMSGSEASALPMNWIRDSKDSLPMNIF